MEKSAKIVLVVVSIIVFLGCAYIAMVYFALSSWSYNLNDARSEWFVSYSPDNANSVKVELVGDAFPFGPQDADIFTNNELLFSDEVSNDGAVGDGNYSIEWVENVAILTFRGEEQRDANYEITFEGDTVTYKRLENPKDG